MHIHIPTEELRSVLEIVSRVSIKHPTLPILQCVYLHASAEGVITYRATNLEIGVEGTVKGRIEHEGSIAVPAHVLLQTISLITHPEVTLFAEGDTLTITTKTSKTSIATQNASDFPSLPVIEGDAYNVSGKNFAYGIKTVAFAASQNSIKPELGCVYIYQKKENTLTFVATDSFRLAEKTIPMANVVLTGHILIPAKNALELAKIAESNKDDPKLTIAENQCVLSWGHIQITSRSVAGNFPDYNQIMPKEFSTHATILVQDVVNALRRTNVFLNKFSQLTLTLTNGTLNLSSKGDTGMTEENITIAQEGSDISISVNQKYLQDILNYITDDSLTVHFTGIGRPMVIEGVYDKSLRYLVMPMNR
ncbi:DNA polymerase III subunit beta [Candidatus Kaiserbacteria bacterium RIFCSPHIGHO2_02_FULL_49_34]|uniref:Beta sliding clamp n=1 Tax=Candidatus Kaiserbacteria bacterium RIFCSPHIGHO2_02_FULL_49_34 TaxID=1798491 RepID=A0A1F6DKN4_9BACT|nr:MAG: DNA polymerase III subunit beta [Candidatus Kaiserbacteria bacterium RIFCSPHIGHO2_02_FULL_49_34]